MLRMLSLVVVALAIVVGVSAYSTSRLAVSGNVAVVSSATALLSVDKCTACTANSSNIVYYGGPAGKTLMIDFTRGTDGTVAYGFQPGAVYTFKDLITVTNQGGRPVAVSVEATNDVGQAISGLRVLSSTGTVLYGISATTQTVADAGSITLTFEWTGGSTAGTYPLKVAIKAD